MIGDTFFIIKMLIFTTIMVVLLQIKIGDYTLEQKSMIFISQSELMIPVNEVAHGGVVAIKHGFNHVVNMFSSKAKGVFNKENLPGHRSIGLQLRRSKEFLQRKADDVKDSMENTIAKPFDDYTNNQINKLKDKRKAMRKQMRFHKGLLSNNDTQKNEDQLDDEIINELQNEGVEVIE
jgi:hypothetical protein